MTDSNVGASSRRLAVNVLSLAVMVVASLVFAGNR